MSDGFLFSGADKFASGEPPAEKPVEGNEAQVKKKAQLTKTKTCLLCEEMAEKKNNYCAAHKRAYENLYRHAVKSKEASGPEWVSWCRIFGGAYMEDSRKVVEDGNQQLAGQVLCDYCKKCPEGTRRKGQKKTIMDLAQYVKLEGARQESAKASQRPLLDWELFSRKLSHKRGWSTTKAG